MTSTDTSADFKPQLRLHRLSWLFALTTSIRQMIIPLAALLVFGARDEASAVAPMIFPLVVAALFVRALWRQWIYRYGFGPRGLVIHEGIIFRNVRQIEYPRIENIDTERGLLHRLFNVAEVNVQTSTGGKPEARIRVLDLVAVQEMRERIFADGARAAKAVPEEPEARSLLHLPVGELVRYGLIDNRGMIIVAALGGLLHEMGLFNIDREILLTWLASSSLAGLAALGPTIQAALALAAIVSALLAVRLLSVVLAIVTLFDFTLTRHEIDLRARYGLLTRIALTLRTPRIQAVHQTQTLLHRWFGRVSLNVDLTGDRGGDEQQHNRVQTRARWLAPVCRTDEAAALIAVALPAVNLAAAPDWQALSPGARRRLFRRTWVLWTLIAMAPSVWYLREFALFVVLAGAPIAWLHARMYVKHTAWALLPDALLYRRGWLTRRLTVAPRARVQSVSMSASPFDRRWRMAGVFVDTAGASAASGALRIRYLEASVARALVRDVYRSAAAFPSDGKAVGEKSCAGKPT
jgi:putative membrane protein